MKDANDLGRKRGEEKVTTESHTVTTATKVNSQKQRRDKTEKGEGKKEQNTNVKWSNLYVEFLVKKGGRERVEENDSLVTIQYKSR